MMCPEEIAYRSGYIIVEQVGKLSSMRNVSPLQPLRERVF